MRKYYYILRRLAKYLIYRVRFLKTILRLYKKKQISVCFFVTQSQLWNLDTLYRYLDEDESFVASVYVFPNAEAGPENKVSSCQQAYEFFDNKMYNVFYGYDIEKKRFKSLSEIGADVVFYDQPHPAIEKKLLFNILSRSCLTCYVPYGFKISSLDKWNFDTDFHNCLWCYFAESLWHSKQYRKFSLIKGLNSYTSGYPKLDVYNYPVSDDVNKKWKLQSKSKKRVIWAPHWSIGDNALNYSTFLDNYKEMFLYAKENPEIDWVLRPHQRLKYELVEIGEMSKREVEDYFNAWNSLPNAYVNWDGDYFDLFKTSDALITDCGSFLAEYLPTQKPILHLINKKSKGYNQLGNIIADSLYRVETFEQLKQYMNTVVIQGDDSKFNERIEALKVVAINKDSAGKSIYEYLKRKLRRA